MMCKRCGYGRVIRFSRGRMCHACAWQPGDIVRAARESQELHQRDWKDALQRFHEGNALWRANEKHHKSLRRQTSLFNALIDNYRAAGVYD